MEVVDGGSMGDEVYGAEDECSAEEHTSKHFVSI